MLMRRHVDNEHTFSVLIMYAFLLLQYVYSGASWPLYLARHRESAEGRGQGAHLSDACKLSSQGFKHMCSVLIMYALVILQHVHSVGQAGTRHLVWHTVTAQDATNMTHMSSCV